VVGAAATVGVEAVISASAADGESSYRHT
jgi:hypothetical protein